MQFALDGAKARLAVNFIRTIAVPYADTTPPVGVGGVGW
jgi:hypothetical protein